MRMFALSGKTSSARLRRGGVGARGNQLQVGHRK